MSRIGLQHLLGVLAGHLRQLRPAEHASDFLGALFASDPTHYGASPACVLLLLDCVMMIRKSRDLRQVGHTQNLIGSGQSLQLLSDCFRRTPADPGINFIKYHRALYASRATLSVLGSA
jgi:hypothetical protein